MQITIYCVTDDGHGTSPGSFELVTFVRINDVDRPVPTTEALHLPQQDVRTTVKVALETPAGMWGDDCSRVGEEWVTDGQGLGVRHVEGSAPKTSRRVESSNDLLCSA
jgi:hypothetical protein